MHDKLSVNYKLRNMRNYYFALGIALLCCINVFSANWMKRLPNHLFLSQVSIPGTHDSATGNGVTLATFSQCQDIDVATQWSLGVRAFDFRPKVNGDHLHINHGIAQTSLRFDDALFLLRDSLIANPSEFAVVHMLYATGYDNEKDVYVTMLNELLNRDDLKDYLIDFRSDLTVGDMRGKILLLSREQYAAVPITGGFFQNWCGWLDWGAQTSCSIIGPGNTVTKRSKLYVQDFSNTTDENGGVKAKIDAVKQMLNFSTKHETNKSDDVIWVFNFASAYHGSLSTANGYRENATNTNAAIIEYLKENVPGPTGVILMDYAGVDRSPNVSTGKYLTRGKEAIDSIIVNNYKWLTLVNQDIYDRVIKRVDRLYSKLEDAETTIAEECKDVAAEFEDDLLAARAVVDSMKSEMDSLCANWLLTESYSIEYTPTNKIITGIISSAQEAQTKYEQEMSVGVVRKENKVVQIYTISGERLNQRKQGDINIVRYANGVVKKELY